MEDRNVFFIILGVVFIGALLFNYTALGNLQIDTLGSLIFTGLIITALYFNPTSAIMIFFVYAIIMGIYYRRWQNNEGFMNRAGHLQMNVSSR